MAGWCAGWMPRERQSLRPPGSVVEGSATAGTVVPVAAALAAGALGTAMGAVGAAAPAVSTVGVEAGPPPEAASPPRWLMKWHPRAGSEPAVCVGCLWPALVRQPPPGVAAGSGLAHQSLHVAVRGNVCLYMHIKRPLAELQV